MKLWRVLAFAAAAMLAALSAARAEYEVIALANVEYAQHDGVKLVADLYQPKGLAKAPAVIAVHGGGWQNGSRATYRYWGPYLAKNGYVVLSIDYRLGKAGAYPNSVYDVKAAIQFVRAGADSLGVDPDRIGLMGDSAGSHLIALVALAGKEPQFSSAYRDDPNVAVPVGVKAVVAFYGVYDMLAQWNHDQIARPHDQIAEKYLGASPMQNRRIYFESSPMSYATVDKKGPRFLLIHGTDDDIVDPASQSYAFWLALNQAGIGARRIILPGAGHFWAADPFENEPGGFGALTAPRLLRFLGESL
ncbi:MAG TPA: alpha/beta hydrolase [Xanthobacteraceae bacterium]|nr:alpha/beta hydrolase [Xanthobacteraceae bacterium]